MSRLLLRASLLSTSLIVLAAQHSRAADATPAAAAPATPARPSITLTMEQAVRTAIDKSFEMQLQNITLINAKEANIRSKSEWDPSVSLSASRSSSQSVTSSTTLEGLVTGRPTVSDGISSSASVSQRLPTGASVSLGTTVFNKSKSNSTISTNPVQYSTSLSLSLSQPLLRGAGIAYNLTNLRTAKITLERAFLSYKGTLMTTVQNVENAYTSLVTARESLAVSRSSLALAQVTRDDTRKRREAGLQTDINVFAAENTYVTSQISVLQAEQSLDAAQDTLRNLLGAAQFDVDINTVDIPDFSGPEPTVENSYRLALENQTDYQSSLANLKVLEMSVAQAKSNRLPSLGLSSSVGYSGRSPDNRAAWTSLRPMKNYNWSLGLNFSMSIPLRSERSNYRTALNGLETAKLQLEQTRQSLLIQVRAAVRSVVSNIQLMKSSALAADLSQKSYEAEKSRYDVGSSTGLTLQTAQSNLESARVSMLRQRLALRTSMSALSRLEGTTLLRYNIQMPK